MYSGKNTVYWQQVKGGISVSQLIFLELILGVWTHKCQKLIPKKSSHEEYALKHLSGYEKKRLLVS